MKKSDPAAQQSLAEQRRIHKESYILQSVGITLVVTYLSLFIGAAMNIDKDDWINIVFKLMVGDGYGTYKGFYR